MLPREQAWWSGEFEEEGGNNAFLIRFTQSLKVANKSVN